MKQTTPLLIAVVALGMGSCESPSELTLSPVDGSGAIVEDVVGETDPWVDSQTCSTIGVMPEGEFLEQGGHVGGFRAHCQGLTHAIAGAGGARLEVSLADWPDGERARVRVTDLLGNTLAGPQTLMGSDRWSFRLPEPGEALLEVQPNAIDAAGHDYELTLDCVDRCNADYSRYPTVFFHGAGGTDAYVGLLDYWFELEDHLTDAGFVVVMDAVDAFAPPEVRGVQWANVLDSLVADGVGRRFNVIGHSQGGLDARYVAGVLGYHDRIVSVVTVATPHRGTPVADAGIGLVQAAPWLVDGAAGVLAGLTGLGDAAAVEQVASMTTVGMAEFNANVLNHPDVYYASYAGKTCSILDFICQAQNNGEIVTPLLAPTMTLLDIIDGDSGDGLVPIWSAQWGDYRGTLPADHMDEVGQIADVWNPAFDHKAFYADEIRRLAEMGF